MSVVFFGLQLLQLNTPYEVILLIPETDVYTYYNKLVNVDEAGQICKQKGSTLVEFSPALFNPFYEPLLITGSDINMG